MVGKSLCRLCHSLDPMQLNRRGLLCGSRVVCGYGGGGVWGDRNRICVEGHMDGSE